MLPVDDTCWEELICVCPNSLVGSVLTYSTVALRTSRVRIMTRGPFPNLPPLLSPTSLPVSSDLSYRNKGENDKKNKKLIICKYSKYHGQLISRSAPSRVRVGSHTYTQAVEWEKKARFQDMLLFVLFDLILFWALLECRVMHETLQKTSDSSTTLFNA